MDTEGPALPNPGQVLNSSSQPASQGRVDDAAMDTEGPALPNPGQMLSPLSQPGSMAGGLGQSAHAESDGMAAGFSPSRPIRPRAVRASFQMPPSPLHQCCQWPPLRGPPLAACRAMQLQAGSSPVGLRRGSTSWPAAAPWQRQWVPPLSPPSLAGSRRQQLALASEQLGLVWEQLSLLGSLPPTP